MSGPELPPGASAAVRFEGGTRPHAPGVLGSAGALDCNADPPPEKVRARYALLVAHLENERLRAAATAALYQIHTTHLDMAGPASNHYAVKHRGGVQIEALRQLLSAPPPPLAELRELVAAADSAIGFECCPRWVHGGSHSDACPRTKLAAVLAAYPFLAPEPE